tara:strand:+ start:5005 stop:6615 length:1611 start_codon:yes stop_codon:yes gene_type:complete
LAIVSISRIQIRRGRKNLGSGLPQLAGGELGWAVDTQELYIGNGAVSEGAPAVGNSKVLTEHDNLFTLSDQYTYRNGSNIQTGVTSATPIKRSLQNRLDDNIDAKSFGATGDGSTDDTLALQRAIDQLFLPWSSSPDADTYKKRIALKLSAGLYKITNSLKLPPYASIIGDGSDKTVINQTGVFPVLETINGEGIAAQTTLINQTTNIELKGLTLNSNTTQPGLKLASCKNSSFTDINIKGPWVQAQGAALVATQIGILLEATSTPVTSKDNTFEKIKVSNFSYAVSSDDDVVHNTFNNSIIEECGYGIVFGKDTTLGGVGQATGPINNTISNSKFIDINLQGIWIKHGTGNISEANNFSTVGNDAGLDTAPKHSVIKFEKNQNITSNDFFARTNAMIRNFNNIAYITEVEGAYSGNFNFTTKFNIGQLNAYTDFLRLPTDTSKTIHMNYVYKNTVDTGMRKGTLKILIDKENNTSHISDDYDFQGTNADQLNFQVTLNDLDADANFETLVVQAINPAPVNSSESANVTIQIQNIS